MGERSSAGPIDCGIDLYYYFDFFFRLFFWVERVEASRYLDSGDSGMYLKRPVGWWIGPPKRRVAWGVKYAAKGGIALLLLLGLFANLTVIGSDEPLGMVPFSSCIARSASTR